MTILRPQIDRGAVMRAKGLCALPNRCTLNFSRCRKCF
jgi:hypothetical protein